MKSFIIHAALILSLLGAFFVQPVTASAACVNPNTAHGQNNGSKNQELNGISQTGGDCTDTGVTNSVSAGVAILSYIAGLTAIIMIVASGFKYATSGGDSNRVSSAKNTLIYALIGAAIAGIAQFLVHYVYNQAATTTSSAMACTYTQQLNTPQGNPVCQTIGVSRHEST